MRFTESDLLGRWQETAGTIHLGRLSCGCDRAMGESAHEKHIHSNPSKPYITPIDRPPHCQYEFKDGVQGIIKYLEMTELWPGETQSFQWQLDS